MTSGPHRRPRRYSKWVVVELILLLVVALFVLWAYRQRIPFL